MSSYTQSQIVKELASRNVFITRQALHAHKKKYLKPRIDYIEDTVTLFTQRGYNKVIKFYTESWNHNKDRISDD
ncbi:MAG: hypothetical protein M9949_04740 [Candidatus Kapabacteria bacterium]|nr:hypothetical protein [Candidatus Kapabacteria bacterium]